MTSTAVVVLVAVLGAVMAALTGAGIGSTLVPLFALQMDFKIAVAAATLPHLVGSAMRALELRRRIDRALVLRFGLLSAVGSLAGALAYSRVPTGLVAHVFASLLIVAGLSGLLGLADRARLPRTEAWIAGALSGFLGGLAGEQGGIRAVALLRFDLRKDAFVATATAVAVLVDVARAPVYLAKDWDGLRAAAGPIGFAVAGVIAGTLLGRTIRRGIPESLFRRVVSGIVLAIGLLLLLRPPG